MSSRDVELAEERVGKAIPEELAARGRLCQAPVIQPSTRSGYRSSTSATCACPGEQGLPVFADAPAGQEVAGRA